MGSPENEYWKQALVPEHLTKITIENLPLDEAFYISPGDDEGFEPPAIFVGPDRELMISRENTIDMDENSRSNILQTVGIMRVVLLNPETYTARECCIADLRFIEWGSLMTTDNISADSVDQEEFMYLANTINNALKIDAFIALDKDLEFEVGKKVPKGTFFGPPELHDHLGTLQKNSNKIMKRFMRHRAVGKTASADSKPDSASDTVAPITAPTKPEQKKKPVDLSVKFSGPHK